MLAAVDELPFTLCVRAPEHEHDMFAFLVECRNRRIGQFFPSFALMATGFVCLDRQRSVEQQYALFRPSAQITALWDRRAQVAMDLLVDIHQRRGYLHTIGHGKRESHGLPFLMVRVLADDDHAHLVKRARVKGVKNKPCRRKTPTGLILLAHILGEEFEIRLVKLRLQYALPRWVYSYIHQSTISIASP